MPSVGWLIKAFINRLVLTKGKQIYRALVGHFGPVRPGSKTGSIL